MEEAGAATGEAGEAEAVTREAEEAEAGGAIDEPFAADTLAVLELEANGQTRLPPLHPHNTVLVALLASFNQLGAAPPQIARYGAPLETPYLPWPHLLWLYLPWLHLLWLYLPRLYSPRLYSTRLYSPWPHSPWLYSP